MNKNSLLLHLFLDSSGLSYLVDKNTALPCTVSKLQQTFKISLDRDKLINFSFKGHEYTVSLSPHKLDTECHGGLDYIDIGQSRSIPFSSAIIYFLSSLCDIFPSQLEVKLPINQFMNFQINKEKILSFDEIYLYPGSFNPFHKGHLHCIEIFKDKNLFVMIDKNPQKKSANSNSLLLLQNVFKNVSKYKKVFLYSGLMLLENKSTHFWVEKIKSNFNHLKLNFVMGDDQLMNFKTWINYQNLISLIDEFHIVPRKYNQATLILNHKNMKEQFLPFKDKTMVFHKDHNHQALSSTLLRSKNDSKF